MSTAARPRLAVLSFPTVAWAPWVIFAADVLYDRALHAPLQAILEANLARRGEALLADPGRPLALDFAARLEAAGWVSTMELLPADPPCFLYRFRRD